MEVIRDDAFINRRKQIGKYTSIVGMGVLIGALILGFVNPERYFFLQLLALPLGWILSQVGLFMAHRYMRSPRADELLDDTLRNVARQGRMYHYVLPAPHVLLMPAGPIVFVTKYQSGDISAEGDRWQQRGVRLWRKIFSQDSLGNPTREAENAVRSLAAFINKRAPSIDEVPVGALIVFTAKNAGELDLEESSIPAMHVTKLRGYFKQKADRDPLPEEDYVALRAAFDEKAGHFLDAES